MNQIFRTRWWVWILGILGISAAMIGRLEAQRAGWSQPMELVAPFPGGDWLPDITVDLQGDAHVVWSGGQCSTNYEKPCLMYQRQRGGNMAARVRCLPGPGDRTIGHSVRPCG